MLSQPGHPVVLVAFMGANDAQDIQTSTGTARLGTAGWRAEYTKRLNAYFDVIERLHVRCYWIGQPVMRAAHYSERMAVLRSLAMAAANGRAGVTFLDSRVPLGGTDGTYRAYLPASSGRLASHGVRRRPNRGRADVITKPFCDPNPTTPTSGIRTRPPTPRRTPSPSTLRPTSPPSTRTTPATPRLGAGRNSVFVLGDPVLGGARQTVPRALAGWAVTFDASGSRRLPQGIEVLKSRRRGIGRVVVIQLGNNYLASEGSFGTQMDQAMRVLTGVSRVVWLTVAEKWGSCD